MKRIIKTNEITLKEIKEFDNMNQNDFKAIMTEKIVTLKAEKILIDDKIHRLNSIINEQI